MQILPEPKTEEIVKHASFLPSGEPESTQTSQQVTERELTHMSDGRWSSTGFPALSEPVQQVRLLPSCSVGCKMYLAVVFTLLTRHLLHGFCLRKRFTGEDKQKRSIYPPAYFRRQG